jgi:glutathione peroxidase
MFKILIIAGIFLTSIYAISYNDTDGTPRSFNDLRGKKILIVNIATGSSKVSQLAQLQQLYLQYQDSLTIVAFPSNSFGNEPKTNAEIKAFCDSAYLITFQLAQKVSVKDSGMHAIYSWLSNASENGAMDGVVVGDFHKFLIDADGRFIGAFAPVVLPMDATIQHAITGN